MKTKNITPYHFILVLISLMVLISCDESIIGSGNLTKESRDVKSFDAIEVSGAFNVFLSQGSEESLVIEADDNLLQFIDTRVMGGKLYLETRRIGFRNPTLRAYITVRDIEEIKANGAVKITGETPIEFRRMLLSASGASDIDLEVFGEKMELKVSGAGKSHLTGEVEKVIISLSGASKLSAETLYTRFMDINISGAGSGNVNVEDELIANISGAGSIRYLGDPKVQSKVSGAGNVKKMK